MTSDGIVEYYEKVSSSNNKEIVCQKAEQWFRMIAGFRDSLKRKEDTIIIRKNIILSEEYKLWKVPRTSHLWGEISGHFDERVNFTIQVVCQDSQYQYWIKNILFTNRYDGIMGDYDSTQTLTLLINELIKTNKEITAIENDSSIGKMKKKSKLDIPKMEAAKNSRSLTNISHLMNAVIASLKEQME
jgi:hypothetical protein